MARNTQGNPLAELLKVLIDYVLRGIGDKVKAWVDATFAGVQLAR